MSDQLVDRPLRSVFVGNIPYEVTEEKLKEIFSEVGPVVSMKLVYDRETGKPKGYGFCEFKDVETAMSAMRNLNGFEINGRILRVDNAGAERHRMTEVNAQTGSAVGHNGPRHVDNHEHHQFAAREVEGPPPPEKVPEVISKAVASLPPDQMFELMKQMKLCIQNNPNEARNMLLQNPQLAYALLQAQVVMKIIDPQTALSMLHKDNTVPVGSLLPEGQTGTMMMGPSSGYPGKPPPQTENPWITAGAVGGAPLMPLNPPGPFGPGPVSNPNQGGDMDFRQMDPRLRNQGGVAPQDLDLRDPRSSSGPGPDRFSMDPRQQRDRDLRDRDLRDRDMRSDPRDRDLRDIRDPRIQIQAQHQQANIPTDPRARARERDREQTASQQAAANASRAAAALPSGMGGLGPGATDTEKAALIMQVLQLSDEQIAMLPPEQRQSILVLKEQIAKSTQR